MPANNKKSSDPGPWTITDSEAAPTEVDMPLIILGILVQVGCAVHALRTGRDMRWIYLILFFPLVGSLIYLIVELLPDLRHSRTLRRTHKTLAKSLDPQRELRASTEQVEISHNVDNLIALAERCIEAGHVDTAIEAYQSALQGVFEDDPKILLGLARARFVKEDFRGCIEVLDQLIERNPKYRSHDGHLLYARALEHAGETDRAVQEYEAVCQSYPGPEAKCHYAMLLKTIGRTAPAAEIFADVLRTARNAPGHYRRMHQDWIALARRESA